MIRWLLTGISTVSLAVNGLLLWQADGFPRDLPPNGIRWMEAYLSLFADPFMASVLFGITALLTLASFCITEILLGLVFITVSACLSFICLLGQVSVHYPPLGHVLIRFLQ